MDQSRWVQILFYQEEKAIADAIGVSVPHYDYDMFFSRRTILTQEYMGLDKNGNDNVVFPLDQRSNEGNTGPNDINHRYITEDIPVNCKIYHELGIQYNVPTPIIDSMILLGGAFHEKNFYNEGKYDLDYIGIKGKSKEELNRYLRELK